MSEVFQAIAWVILGMVLMGLAVWFVTPSMMLVTHKSRRGYAETLAALNEAVAKKPGWKMLAVNDYQQATAPFAALEHVGSVNVCNPQYASTILSSDKNRIVSAFMPLAVGVYEDKTGQVYVTEMNVGLMGRMFGGMIAKVMGRAGQDLDEMIASVTAKEADGCSPITRRAT